MKLGARIQWLERQPVKVACLRYIGPMGEPLGRFWRATVTPWLADHGLLDCPRYGVSLDIPGTAPPEECRYDACVELPGGLTPPETRETLIPGGLYAVTHFAGTAREIAAAWNSFAGAALSGGAGRLDAGRRPFEHYPRGATYDARSGAFSCELCLPVAR